MVFSRLFSCTMDELLTRDMEPHADCYSEVSLTDVPAMRLARHVVISPQPERDVQMVLERWAQESGLAQVHAPLRSIGWDFPFVSGEQQSRFGLRGYAAGWILPEGFEPGCPGMELFSQPPARYAKLTMRDPFSEAFDRIPKGYQRILAYLGANGFKESHGETYIPCFEEVYEREGVTYMDIYVHAECVGRANLHTDFSRGA